MAPLQALRHRWQLWWQARQSPADTHQTTQRNVYILPTRAGWMLAITLLLLLVASTVVAVVRLHQPRLTPVPVPVVPSIA